MTIQTERKEPVEEVVHRTTLPDGLSACLVPRPGWAHRYAVLAVGYGSADETFAVDGGPEETTPAGIAHFLEHSLFKGPEGDALDEFSRLGAAANAFTGRTMTAYLFSCTERFEEGLDILCDLVGRADFPAEEVEKEKAIISREIRMYDDEPSWRIYQNLLESLYHRHPVRTDIAGTVESVASVGDEDLRRCHRTFYNPRNMVLCVAGDLDAEAVFGRAEEAFARNTFGRPADVRRVRPEDEPPGPLDEERTVELSVARPRVWVGWKDPSGPLRGDALLRKKVEVRLLLDLLFGRGSAFYEEHYESGLIDDSFGAFHDGGVDYGVSVAGGETDDPDRLVEVVRAEVEEARERDPAELADDLERVRRKAVGRFHRGLNSMERVVHRLAAGHFEGVDPFRSVEILGGVTPRSIHGRLDAQLAEGASAVSRLVPRGGA